MTEPPEYPRDPKQEVQVSADDLQALVSQMFVKKSVFAVDAEIAAARIVEADLRGISSHGCRMMKWYLGAFDQGFIDPRGQVLVISETPAIATLDGSSALGQVAATKAMQLAIEKAREVGTGTVAVKNSHHLGAAGVFVQMAVDQGMIGYCTTTTGGATVAAHGSKQGATANHALAWGIPTPSGPPIILDMACAKASWGKVNALGQYGLPIPLDWALDETGEPTIDSSLAKLLTPAAGPRGYGLGLVSGILAGALVGGRMPIVRKRKAMAEASQHFCQVIDPEKFGEPDRFAARVEEAVAAIHALEPAEGFEQVRLPGERQWKLAQESREHGIFIHRNDAEMLETFADEFGIKVPWT